MFGGLSKETAFDDLWRFDILKNSWHLVETKGTRPSARVAHTTTYIGESFLVVFGGMTRSPKLVTYDDIFVLNLQTKEWSRIDAAAAPPGPPGTRLDHDICLVPRLVRTEDGISVDLNRIADGSDSIKSPKDLSAWSLLLYGGMNIGNVFNDTFELCLDFE